MDYIELFKDLIEKISVLDYRDDVTRDEINRKLMLYIKKCFGDNSDYITDIQRIEFYSWDFDNERSQVEAWNTGKEKLTNMVNVIIEDLELSSPTMRIDERVERKMESYKKVFIIHGHDEALKQEVARFVEKLDLQAVILHEQANKGKTIIEKFEDASDVGFAIALLTPDDKVVHENDNGDVMEFYRARQNVVFEMGFFIGAIGRDRVFPLVKGEKIEIPSDYSGVVYTKYDAGSWKLDLIKELKTANYEFDANKAF